MAKPTAQKTKSMGKKIGVLKRALRLKDQDLNRVRHELNKYRSVISAEVKYNRRWDEWRYETFKRMDKHLKIWVIVSSLCTIAVVVYGVYEFIKYLWL